MADGVDHAAPAQLEIFPVRGLPELRPGDDLAALLAAALPDLRTADVVVVTSKAVSKVEGRLLLVPADPAGREAARQAAVAAETVRLVAARGRTRIVQTRHGLVLASAGVDTSNVRPEELALLPVDPDASARRLRTRLRDLLGVEVAVVVSDTTGRPWRTGLVDIAIGVAGLTAVVDLRAATDQHGNVLQLTEVALGDEVAAAADLCKGKLGGTAAAVVRGLSPVDDGRGARALVRPADQDLFRLGTAEALAEGRALLLRELATAAASFRPGGVAAETLKQAWPTGSRGQLRTVPPDRADRLVAAGLAVPATAGSLAVLCLPADAVPADWYSAGTAVERFRLALAAESLASAVLWGPDWPAETERARATAVLPRAVAESVQLAPEWQPVAVLAIGRPG